MEGLEQQLEEFMSIVSDPTANNLQAALHLLSQRLEALQDNVANVSTPGFTARRIEFEDELALAVADGNPFAAKAREVASDDPRDGAGNNVNLGKEMVQLTETALRQQALVRALNDQYQRIRIATKEF